MSTKTKEPQYYYGTGRRKTAIARVRLYARGSGKLMVNDRERSTDELALAPLVAVGEQAKWDLSAKVRGGGIEAQRQAIRHGLARALLAINPQWRQTLKKAGFLTRDPREKERMKPGLKRARRAPQWAKR